MIFIKEKNTQTKALCFCLIFKKVQALIQDGVYLAQNVNLRKHTGCVQSLDIPLIFEAVSQHHNTFKQH